jgi:hypothetical protein
MPPTAEDIYTEQVLKLKKGTPLYLPCAVEVGDVGFIDPLGGFFQKLYNVAKPPMDNEPGCPSRIFLESTCHPEQWDAFHVCYLSCFILRTLPDFLIILAEEIKEVRGLIERIYVGQPVAVHLPITETRSSAPRVNRDLNSQN